MMLNVKQVQKLVKKPATKPRFHIVTDNAAKACLGVGSYLWLHPLPLAVVSNMQQLLNLPDGANLLVLQFEPEPPTHSLCAVARGMIERGTFKQMICDTAEGDAP